MPPAWQLFWMVARVTGLLWLSLLPALVRPVNRQPAGEDFRTPLGLPPIPWPEDNPYSPARAELGRILFFDGRLSANDIVSCAFCHEPDHAFAGGTSLSRGVNGMAETRHTPLRPDQTN